MINWQDYDISAPAEYIGYYGDGGWFPIYIHEIFGGGRYKIVNKLGFGGYATVWVARDLRHNTIVSLKVIRANDSNNNQELRILQCIQQAPSHPGRQHLPRLLDHFYEERYGKKNLFLVLELLGPEVSAFSDIAPNFLPSVSRQITKELLLAIDCLHSYGIVHGDIHPGNILFRMPAGCELPLDDVYKGEVVRKDGTSLEEGLPKYVVAPLSQGRAFKAQLEDFTHICLIDFSTSFFAAEAPESLHTIITGTPPELIFRKPLSKSFDIWSLACTTFYLATRRTLFDTWGGEWELIPLINKVVGESSAQWLLNELIYAIQHGIWKNVSNFHLSQGSGYSILEDYIRLKDKALIRFLRRCLVVDPTKRATAAELQAEEWVGV